MKTKIYFKSKLLLSVDFKLTEDQIKGVIFGNYDENNDDTMDFDNYNIFINGITYCLGCGWNTGDIEVSRLEYWLDCNHNNIWPDELIGIK